MSAGSFCLAKPLAFSAVDSWGEWRLLPLNGWAIVLSSLTRRPIAQRVKLPTRKSQRPTPMWKWQKFWFKGAM